MGFPGAERRSRRRWEEVENALEDSRSEIEYGPYPIGMENKRTEAQLTFARKLKLINVSSLLG